MLKHPHKLKLGCLGPLYDLVRLGHPHDTCVLAVHVGRKLICHKLGVLQVCVLCICTLGF